jgi:hypothetical protein
MQALLAGSVYKRAGVGYDQHSMVLSWPCVAVMAFVAAIGSKARCMSVQGSDTCTKHVAVYLC